MDSGLRDALGRRYEGYPEVLEASHIQHAGALLRSLPNTAGQADLSSKKAVPRPHLC